MMEPEDTSQNDSTTPPAHTFNMQTGVAIILGKALLGFVFIILSAALSAADDFNVNEYMIMGFLGAYLLVDSALNFIPDSVVILINNRFGSIKNNFLHYYHCDYLDMCIE